MDSQSEVEVLNFFKHVEFPMSSMFRAYTNGISQFSTEIRRQIARNIDRQNQMMTAILTSNDITKVTEISHQWVQDTTKDGFEATRNLLAINQDIMSGMFKT